MEWTDFLKVYGPLAIGWIVAAYLMKFVLDRYSPDIDARVKLATALDNLAKLVGGTNHGGRDE